MSNCWTFANMPMCMNAINGFRLGRIQIPCIFAAQICRTMKKGTHPENYRLVVFKDMSNDYSFIGKSTVNTKETVQWEDGNEYPLVKLEITSQSHPFFTGKMQLVDTAGRIDKFKSRYAKFEKKK